MLWDEKLRRSRLIYPVEPGKAQQAVEVCGALVNRRRPGWNARQLGDLVLFTSRHWELYSLGTSDQRSSGLGVSECIRKQSGRGRSVCAQLSIPPSGEKAERGRRPIGNWKYDYRYKKFNRRVREVGS